MINIRIEQDREEGWLSLELIGHASFAELGQDPVCAGASAIAMTAAQCAKSMEEAGRLQKKARIIVRNGRVLVTIKPKAERWDEAAHLFWVCSTGLRLLEEAYPGTMEIQGAG